jgi:hypothetical protein
MNAELSRFTFDLAGPIVPLAAHLLVQTTLFISAVSSCHCLP